MSRCSGSVCHQAERSVAQTPPPAPTLITALPCYSALAHVELSGDGWSPSGQVHLQARYVNDGSAFDATVTADAMGHIAFIIAAPTFASLGANTHPISVSAVDLVRAGAGAPPEQRAATVAFSVTYWGVFYRPWNTNGPARGKPGRVRTLESSGWIGSNGKTLYAHYRRLGHSSFRTTVVGILGGDCGGLRVPFREFDFRPVPRGTYRVFFDTSQATGRRTLKAPNYARVRAR